MPVKLTYACMGMTMKRTDTKLEACGVNLTGKSGGERNCFTEAAANVVTHQKTLTIEVNQAVDYGEGIFRSDASLERTPEQRNTYSSPLRIIWANQRINPWRHACYVP